MTTRQIFGRDPSLIASAVAGVVALLGSVVFDWTGDRIGVVNAALAAGLIVYTSWGTVDKATSAILQLTKALLILAVTFGAHITADQTALVIIAVEGLVGAFARTQVSAVVAAPANRGSVVVRADSRDDGYGLIEICIAVVVLLILVFLLFRVAG